MFQWSFIYKNRWRVNFTRAIVQRDTMTLFITMPVLVQTTLVLQTYQFFYFRASACGILPKMMSTLCYLDNPAFLSGSRFGIMSPDQLLAWVGLPCRYFVQFVIISALEFIYHLSSWTRVNSVTTDTVLSATCTQCLKQSLHRVGRDSRFLTSE